MNIEGLAALIFGAMILAFTATLAILSGNPLAVVLIWLGIGSAYAAQVCFYSFVHVRGSAFAGMLLWIVSIGTTILSFMAVMS